MREKGQSLVEAAVGLPILLLILLGIINLALYGMAGMNASNAANYGARRASVAQANAPAIALSSTQAKLAEVPIGDYQVTVTGGGRRGDLIQITVHYQVPNFLGALGSLFSAGPQSEIAGYTASFFRQEGW